jgi:hypothetical protein
MRRGHRERTQEPTCKTGTWGTRRVISGLLVAGLERASGR